ncbi:MAG: DUF1684 domain-containing protein [Candidatus Latescibacteria bacterium]|nr:DUF1684 domain-containing protein [Candidatus Latescibacterota bacterium]
MFCPTLAIADAWRRTPAVHRTGALSSWSSIPFRGRSSPAQGKGDADDGNGPGRTEVPSLGELRYKIGGEKCTLRAYKGEFQQEALFVPFTDASSGTQTYGGGRYIDLHPDRDRAPEGKWVLDFNKACNPWCACSEAYTCGFVPPENWLKLPVRADEKDYTHHKQRVTSGGLKNESLAERDSED